MSVTVTLRPGTPDDNNRTYLPEPTGPYGARGIGEITMVPGAPAIANAVANAIGRIGQRTGEFSAKDGSI